MALPFGLLLRCLYDAAGNSRTGISRGIALQIIFLFVDNDRSANDRIAAAQRHFTLPLDMGLAGFVGLDVAEIAVVPFGCGGPAVMLLCGIKMTTGRRGVSCRAIALVVNMKTVLTRSEILDVA